MSDDRYSTEQQEIDRAAQAAKPPKLPERCGAPAITGDSCELGPGHVGQHRFTHPGGSQMWWPHHVGADEIERFVEEELKS